jgi:peroxiredoxin
MSKKPKFVLGWTFSILSGVMMALPAFPADGVIAESAEDTKPLKAGVQAPDVTMENLEGEPIKLSELWSKQPIALVFYRGGWCPYCNTHLAALKDAEPELVKLGYQVVAVSPDKPAILKESADKAELNYELVSDSDAEAMKAFGIAFRLDDGTLQKYKEYGIDLEEASGEDHHALPIPAVFLIDQKGKIRWVHANPDYKKRVSNEKLVAAAKKAAAKGEGS